MRRPANVDAGARPEVLRDMMLFLAMPDFPKEKPLPDVVRQVIVQIPRHDHPAQPRKTRSVSSGRYRT
jgi:hypothetical protein